MFHCSTGDPGTFLVHISEPVGARDFKFAGSVVQMLYLVMVALTQTWLSAHYAWFSHGRSHMC